MKRTIKQLSRYEMLVIATEYANTPCSASGDFFSERYGVSKNTFYSILHKAIIESIVTIDVARQIARKASYNTRQHGGEGAEIRTNRVYNEDIKQRENFRFGREEAKKWVEMYADSKDTLEIFCRKNFLSPILLQRAIVDVSTYNWITSEYLDKLMLKAWKSVVIMT